MSVLRVDVLKLNYLKYTFVYCFLLLILLFGCRSAPVQDGLLPARVTRVVSGQTLEVVLAETSEVIKVRIIGIDAPDLRQSPWGKTAKQKLSELVMGLPIKLETEAPEESLEQSPPQDRFHRLNAHIWQDKTLVSQKLVKSGCVLANTKYNHPYSKLLIDAQEYARLMGFGIWNPDQAMRYTPNQYRSITKQ